MSATDIQRILSGDATTVSAEEAVAIAFATNSECLNEKPIRSNAVRELADVVAAPAVRAEMIRVMPHVWSENLAAGTCQPG